RADGRPLLTPAEQQAREERLAPIRKRIAELEASLGSLYRSVRPPVAPAGAPAPVAQWRFDTDARDDFGSFHASLTGAAELASGRLRPAEDKEAVTLATPPLSFDIRAKTLEAWVRVRKLPEKPASVLRIRNRAGFRGAAFDGIQYVPGEKGEKKQWENVSTARFRTGETGAPGETAAEGDLVQIAIVYAADDTIRFYRNGAPHGEQYKPETGVPQGRLQTYVKDDAIVELTASKELELEQARLYNLALTPAQVAASYAAGAASLAAGDLIAAAPPAAQQRLARLREELAQARDLLKSVPEPEKVFAASIQAPELTYLLFRGDVNKKGELIAPGALSSLAGLSADLGLSREAPEAERRRKLAEWIASPGNPLFSRVMVNRLWHHHFGAGLVENPNDFGFNGGRPSHPELLDWLAGEFIRGGWSLKELHRLIVTSEAYRQSSRFNPAAAAKDAGNRLLWRYSPRRLEAEAIRDAVLAVSGKLNSEMYGPSFRPFQIVKNPGSYHSYDPVDSGDPGLQRRTVYRMSVNSGGNPMLEALDCPLPSIKTPKRNTTTTALQALSLMNNAFIHRQAKIFAERLTSEVPDTTSRVARAFRLAFGRDPEGVELASSISLIERHGLGNFCWGLFNASEFVYVH
ncbi:MAG: DUF1553 domain-containing protein, partial [Acidobacteria bacterium]|nr:DUF1553 domain-containing protein [Acidobacteriota bacterium]